MSVTPPNRSTSFSFHKPHQDPEDPSSSNSLSPYVLDLNFENFATPQVAAAFAVGSLATVGVIALYTRYVRRIPTSDWVHPSMIAKKRWIKGVVTNVGDGDGFRLYHTPGPFWRWPVKLRRVPAHAKELKDETIHIRLAGVDAPEGAHFGKQPQPYAADALQWLKNEVEGQRLWVQVIRRDQYGRVVAIPMYPPRLPLVRAPASRCVSIAMLRAGFATTYEQAGAEYGRWGKDVFLHYEAAARAAKRGMWASTTALESPSEYKKRHREGTPLDPTSVVSMHKDKRPRGWLSVLTFWR